jgi:hypothetical protein
MFQATLLGILYRFPSIPAEPPFSNHYVCYLSCLHMLVCYFHLLVSLLDFEVCLNLTTLERCFWLERQTYANFHFQILAKG